MNQFQTVLVGGYRKEEVDERLKELVSQIEELHQEAKAAGEREEQLKSELAAAVRRAEELEESQKTAMPDGEYDESAYEGLTVKEREERLKRELDAALSRLEFLESELEQGSGTHSTQTMPDRDSRRRMQLKEELAAALKWSESLEAELKLAREEKDARMQSRILELERTKALNKRIMDLEEERERRETEYRSEISELQSRLDQQRRSCDAAERILQMAEEEARTLVEEAQAKARQLECRTEEDIRAKRRAAVQALEGARIQVVRYLETFNITREKLAETYNELDALVDQIPSGFVDGTVIEMDRNGFPTSWPYPTDAQ